MRQNVEGYSVSPTEAACWPCNLAFFAYFCRHARYAVANLIVNIVRLEEEILVSQPESQLLVYRQFVTVYCIVSGQRKSVQSVLSEALLSYRFV
jgi:hypothetical protein